MIEIQNLTVDYRNINSSFNALYDINMEIQDGDIFTVLGPSGCGKSTLLYVLSGLIRNFKGRVYINNKAVITCGLFYLSHTQNCTASRGNASLRSW